MYYNQLDKLEHMFYHHPAARAFIGLLAVHFRTLKFENFEKSSEMNGFNQSPQRSGWVNGKELFLRCSAEQFPAASYPHLLFACPVF
jgi:hypothetical protein